MFEDCCSALSKLFLLVSHTYATLNLLLAFRRVVFLTSGPLVVSSTLRRVFLQHIPQCVRSSSRSGARIPRQSFALKFFVEDLVELDPVYL